MAWAFGAIGAVAHEDGAGSVTANAPTFSAGDLFVIASGVFAGTQTLTPPGGWVQISPGVNVTNVFYMFARVAQVGDVMPTLPWGATSIAWAVCASFTVPGLVDNSQIVVDVNSGDRASTNTTSIIGTASARTPAQANCLALFAGTKNKTTASDTSVFTATDAAFTQDFTETRAGNTRSAASFQHWVQGAATATSGGATGSVADGAAQTFKSALVFLQIPPAFVPSSGGGGFIASVGSLMHRK